MNRKTKLMLFVSIFVAIMLHLSIALAYNINEKVEVQWKGKWYPAIVLKINSNKYFIHYEGYAKSWDEWVAANRIRVISSKNKQNITIKAPKEMTIRKSGSIWATVEKDGTIRINGSIVGEFESDGTVRKSGSIIGAVESDGTIRESGSIVGEIEKDGTFRKSGSIIGEIEKSGSIWGEASNCCNSYKEMRAVAAVLTFFTDDFGF